MADQKAALNEWAFRRNVEAVLRSLLDAESIDPEPRLPGAVSPDFIAHLPDGRVAIVEVKAVTPATSTRVEQAAAELGSYADAYIKGPGRNGPSPQLVLVVPGALAPERVRQLGKSGIHVIDGPALKSADPTLRWPDEEAPKQPDTRVRRHEVAVESTQLIRELEQIDPGHDQWALYQRKVRDILTAMLCPPLQQPLTEDPNMSKINRRDILFPNYAEDGFWKYLRDLYEAHFLVVDAKNNSDVVTKDNVLQVANYLNPTAWVCSRSSPAA